MEKNLNIWYIRRFDKVDLEIRCGDFWPPGSAGETLRQR